MIPIAAVTPTLAWLAFLAELRFRDTVTLGSIIVGAIVALTTLLTAGYGIKWRTAAQVAEQNAQLYHEQAIIYHDKAEALEADKNQLLHLVSEQRESIKQLEALPNLARVIELMAATAKRQDEHSEARLSGAMAELTKMIDGHERRADNRSLAILAAIQGLRHDEPPS